jgi:hypothetical protein
VNFGFVLSLVLVMLAVVDVFIEIPIVSDYAFWFAVGAYIMLAGTDGFDLNWVRLGSEIGSPRNTRCGNVANCCRCKSRIAGWAARAARGLIATIRPAAMSTANTSTQLRPSTEFGADRSAKNGLETALRRSDRSPRRRTARHA